MTRRERYNLESLRKRRDWLSARLTAHRGPPLHFDLAERSALTWAIDTLAGMLATEDDEPERGWLPVYDHRQQRVGRTRSGAA